jgi:MFS family permease
MPVTLVFAVVASGGSVADIGWVLAVSTTARVGLMLAGGVLADRLPRRLVLLGSDFLLAVLQAGMGLLLLTGRSSVPAVAITGALYGAGVAMARPALTGLVPQTVDKQRLQQANALMGMSQSVARIAGPLIAGVMVAATNPGWVYLLDAVTFLVSAVCLARLRLPASAPRDRTSFVSDLAEGWRELATRRWYWVTLCAHAVWNLAICALFVVGPIVVAESLGGPSAWGLVSTGLAVGALLGGLVALRFRPHRPLIVAHLTLALSALELVALAVPMPLVVIFLTAVLGAGGMTFTNEVWATVVQRLIPEKVISRVSSYDWLLSFVAQPVGFAGAGPVAVHLGTGPTLLGASVLIVLPCLAILLLPEIRELRQTADGLFTGRRLMVCELATSGSSG